MLMIVVVGVSNYCTDSYLRSVISLDPMLHYLPLHQSKSKGKQKKI